MSVEPHDRDDEFIERIARPLRNPERFGDDFETSLVEAIRQDGTIVGQIDRQPAQARPSVARRWWNAPSVRLSPLAAVALAASVAAVASMVSLKFAPPASRAVSDGPRAVASVQHDTVTLVRFIFVGQATSVSLVGDFNAWGATPTQLRVAHNGAWTASVPLPKGRHEYAFIVDGKRWVPDPFAPTNPDEFEANSSVITIGD
jgi:hypothetical protein